MAITNRLRRNLARPGPARLLAQSGSWAIGAFGESSAPLPYVVHSSEEPTRPGKRKATIDEADFRPTGIFVPKRQRAAEPRTLEMPQLTLLPWPETDPRVRGLFWICLGLSAVISLAMLWLTSL